MKSLKNISRLTLAIVFISIGVAIFTNFSLLKHMQTFISQNTNIIEKSRVEISDMEISIRILKNLNGILIRAGETAFSQKQIIAYRDNQSQLIKATNNLIILLDELKDNYAEIDRWSFGSQAKLISKLAQNLDKIHHDLLNHNTEFSHMEMTIESHESMVKTFKGLAKLNMELNEMLLNDISLIINILVFVLITIIVFLVFGITRFVNNDLPYIMKSLSQIESHQYDVTQLPSLSSNLTEQKVIINYIEEIMSERQFIMKIRDLLIKHFVVDDVVSELFEIIQDRINVDRIGVAFVDYNQKKIIAEFGIARYEPILLGPGFEVSFDNTSISKILTEKSSIIFNDLEYDFKQKPNSPSLTLIRREGIQSNLIIPLISNGVVFGMVFLSSLNKNYFKEKDQQLAEKIIYEITGILNKSYFTKVILSKFTASFAQIVESKDNETGKHIERMVEYAVIIAKGVREKCHPDYQISNKDILEIERNASSHDIGKVGIPDNILKKPGKLTSDEWEIMKTHSDIGANVFAELRKSLRLFDEELFKKAEEIARSHHEKWDGSGYPNGLSGTEIPLSARIVAVSDVFDALTTKRIYKAAFDFEDSVEIILKGRGIHFDPFVVDCFIEKCDEIRKIYDLKGEY